LNCHEFDNNNDTLQDFYLGSAKAKAAKSILKNPVLTP